MKKSFFILLALLFSCSTDKVPENVLSKDEMVNILIEVHLLESKIQKLYINKDSSKVLYQHYEDMLFDEKNIDREEYNRSMIYYVDHGYLMTEIYNQVVDSLLARQQTYEN